jgi:hypothetical protein
MSAKAGTSTTSPEFVDTKGQPPDMNSRGYKLSPTNTQQFSTRNK